MNLSLKPILIGTAAGLFVGLALMGLIALAVFGAADNAYLARVLFPYAAAVDLDASAVLVLSLFFLQWPLYGGLLGTASHQFRYRTLIMIATLVLIVGGHIAAFRAAERTEAIWLESQTWE